MSTTKIKTSGSSTSKSKRKISEVGADVVLKEKQTQKKQRNGEQKSILTNSAKPKPNEQTAVPSTERSTKKGRKLNIVSHDADNRDVDAQSQSNNERSEDAAEEEIRLEGFSSESDSSDGEFNIEDVPTMDISKLPHAKDDVTIQKKLEKAKKRQNTEKGIIYLGRIPHGFYEDQMRAYFSQFGEVTRLRLSRSKKTGRSKHYAFIEFASTEVAQIVSETMNNYLLMGHILQCRIIPKDQVHPELWVGANRKWRFVPRDRITRQKQNMIRTREQQEKAETRLIARQKEKQTKIVEAGIDYDFEAVAYKRKTQEV